MTKCNIMTKYNIYLMTVYAIIKKEVISHNVSNNEHLYIYIYKFGCYTTITARGSVEQLNTITDPIERDATERIRVQK